MKADDVHPRYFTVDEANRTLPLVSRIVNDIVEEYRRWRENLYRYELLAAKKGDFRDESTEQADIRLLVDRSAERINDFIDELALIGCVFKGFEEGLVDFRGRIDGRDVMLCWKLGEAAVEHWHEIDGGYSGRKLLDRQLIGGQRDG